MGFLDRWCSEDEQNLIGYENGTYDVLMGVARASENPVARTAFLHDAETMLLGETALSPVYFDGTAHMLRDTLRGVYTDGFGNSYFAGVREHRLNCVKRNKMAAFAQKAAIFSYFDRKLAK